MHGFMPRPLGRNANGDDISLQRKRCCYATSGGSARVEFRDDHEHREMDAVNNLAASDYVGAIYWSHLDAARSAAHPAEISVGQCRQRVGGKRCALPFSRNVDQTPSSVQSRKLAQSPITNSQRNPT